LAVSDALSGPVREALGGQVSKVPVPGGHVTLEADGVPAEASRLPPADDPAHPGRAPLQFASRLREALLGILEPLTCLLQRTVNCGETPIGDMCCRRGPVVSGAWFGRRLTVLYGEVLRAGFVEGVGEPVGVLSRSPTR
jgi:hypothetical protein